MMGSAVRAWAEEIERALLASGDPERAVHEKRYLKSELRHFGVRVPAIRKVARAAAKAHPDLTHGQLIELVDRLWGRGVHELRMAAVELLVERPDCLSARDAPWLERLLRESQTWALVDVLSAHIVGGLVERHTALGRLLDRWAEDPDFWIRRAALLALLGPLRRGEGDFARFARYADAMLDEKEFFIRKAIGWVLRERGKVRPDDVVAFLLPRIGRTSGVTLREAVKWLPAKDRKPLLSAYRRTRGPRGKTAQSS